MSELSKLPNLGKVVEEQLFAVGITTAAELKKVGSKKAWLRILEIDDSACIHRLYALEGAIQNIKKTQLSEADKKDLKAFYQEVKGK